MPYLTIKEAAELTERNEKTIRRLIKHPGSKDFIKVEEGKFLIEENYLRKFYKILSAQQTGHVHGHASTQKEEMSSQEKEPLPTTPNGVDIPLPKEYYLNLVAAKDATIHVISEQLQIKDHQLQERGQQINQLIERDRESNIIIQSLQDKMAKQLPAGSGAPAEASTKQKEKVSIVETVLMSVALLSAIALIGFIGLMIYAYLNR